MDLFALAGIEVTHEQDSVRFLMPRRRLGLEICILSGFVGCVLCAMLVGTAQAGNPILFAGFAVAAPIFFLDLLLTIFGRDEVVVGRDTIAWRSIVGPIPLSTKVRPLADLHKLSIRSDFFPGLGAFVALGRVVAPLARRDETEDVDGLRMHMYSALIADFGVGRPVSLTQAYPRVWNRLLRYAIRSGRSSSDGASSGIAARTASASDTESFLLRFDGDDQYEQRWKRTYWYYTLLQPMIAVAGLPLCWFTITSWGNSAFWFLVFIAIPWAGVTALMYVPRREAALARHRRVEIAATGSELVVRVGFAHRDVLDERRWPLTHLAEVRAEPPDHYYYEHGEFRQMEELQLYFWTGDRLRLLTGHGRPAIDRAVAAIKAAMPPSPLRRAQQPDAPLLPSPP